MSTRSRPLIALVATILGLAALTPPASAAPGDLDPTWSGDGKVVTELTAGGDVPFGIEVQPDGKVVVVGRAGGAGGRFFVARYTAAGVLDPTFGTNGRVFTDFSPGDDVVFGVGVQPDGKVVVAGTRSHLDNPSRIVVARYTAAGALDNSFGGNGRVITNFPTDTEYAREMALLDDGRIVVVGGAARGRNGLVAVARYTASGTPDHTFSGDGYTSVDLGQNFEGLEDVAVQPDGRIVAVGLLEGPLSAPAGFRSVVLRFTTTGQLDPTWSGDGRVVRNVANGYEDLLGVVVVEDGSVVAAGEATDRVAVHRYLDDGSVDPSFDGDGVRIVNLPGATEWVGDVALDDAGRIVVAGRMSGAGGRAFVARLLGTGALDPSFSGDGYSPVDFSPRFDAAGDLAIQDDGAIVFSVSVDDERRVGVGRLSGDES
jgi:uncharacterized delta-60 repeat protein